jgi:HK97 gp10 family phage protein
MEKATAFLEKYVKTHFTLRGTGHTVKGVWQEGIGRRRTKSGKKHHYAAAPGLPPAVDMGVLRSSIMHVVECTNNDAVEGKVGPDVQYIAAKAEAGTDAEYGLYLELGTGKMKARPYLRPALADTASAVHDYFKKANS